MVFIPYFNNISVISWRSVLLVEETGGPRENHRPAASHWQTLSYNVVWRLHLAMKITIQYCASLHQEERFGPLIEVPVPRQDMNTYICQGCWFSLCFYDFLIGFWNCSDSVVIFGFHFRMMIWFRFLVFNATFSNISAISWRPVLVVEEAGVPGENHRQATG
jgi:hypothetical protein